MVSIVSGLQQFCTMIKAGGRALVLDQRARSLLGAKSLNFKLKEGNQKESPMRDNWAKRESLLG